MKRILIIGGNGFVGGHLAATATKAGYEPAVADTADESAVEGMNYIQTDITDFRSVEAAFKAVRPDVALNVAAVADIDRAERDRRLAELVNVVGAANAARAAAAAGAKYCWFSSDAVFAGVGEEGEGYGEDAPPAPVNYYGRTKEMGEEAVLKAHPGAVVPRLSLVLGFPLRGGNSFLAGLHARLSAGQAVTGHTCEVRTPIDVLTLCQAVYELFETGYAGVIHLGSTGPVSRYELSRMLAERLGHDPALVVPSGEADAARAPRHRNGILDVRRAQALLKRTKLLSVGETADRAVATLRKGEIG